MISPKPISFRVGDALRDAVEGAPAEEVGRVHRVTRAPQLVGEGVEARCLSLCVVEEQYVGHFALSVVCGGPSTSTHVAPPTNLAKKGLDARAVPWTIERQLEHWAPAS